jgi:hypothetical protein
VTSGTVPNTQPEPGTPTSVPIPSGYQVSQCTVILGSPTPAGSMTGLNSDYQESSAVVNGNNFDITYIGPSNTPSGTLGWTMICTK